MSSGSEALSPRQGEREIIKSFATEPLLTEHRLAEVSTTHAITTMQARSCEYALRTQAHTRTHAHTHPHTRTHACAHIRQRKWCTQASHMNGSTCYRWKPTWSFGQRCASCPVKHLLLYLLISVCVHMLVYFCNVYVCT